MNELQAIQWIRELDEEVALKKNDNLTSVERFVLAYQRDAIIKDKIYRLEKRAGSQRFSTELESQMISDSAPTLITTAEENQKAIEKLRAVCKEGGGYFLPEPSISRSELRFLNDDTLRFTKDELERDFAENKFQQAFLALLSHRKSEGNEWQLKGDELDKTFHTLFNDPTHGGTNKSLDLTRCTLKGFEKLPIESQQKVLIGIHTDIQKMREWSFWRDGLAKNIRIDDIPKSTFNERERTFIEDYYPSHFSDFITNREPTKTGAEDAKKSLNNSLNILSDRVKHLSGRISVLDWEKECIENVGNKLGRMVADQKREREKNKDVITPLTLSELYKTYRPMQETLHILADEWDEHRERLESLKNQLAKNQDSLSPREKSALNEEMQRARKNMHSLSNEIESRMELVLDFLQNDVPQRQNTQNRQEDPVLIAAHSLVNGYTKSIFNETYDRSIFGSNLFPINLRNVKDLLKRLNDIEVWRKGHQDAIENESIPNISESWQRIQDAYTKSRMPETKGNEVRPKEIIDAAIAIFQGINLEATQLLQNMQHSGIEVDRVNEMHKMLQRLRSLAEATPNEEIKKLGDLATTQMDEVLLPVIGMAAHQVEQSGYIAFKTPLEQLKVLLVTPYRIDSTLNYRMAEIERLTASLQHGEKTPEEKARDAISIGGYIEKTFDMLNDNSNLGVQSPKITRNLNDEAEYSRDNGERRDAPPRYNDLKQTTSTETSIPHAQSSTFAGHDYNGEKHDAPPPPRYEESKQTTSAETSIPHAQSSTSAVYDYKDANRDDAPPDYAVTESKQTKDKNPDALFHYDDSKQTWIDNLDSLNALQTDQQWQERAQRLSKVAASFTNDANSISRSLAERIAALQLNQQVQEPTSGRFTKFRRFKEGLGKPKQNEVDTLNALNQNLVSQIESIQKAVKVNTTSNKSKIAVEIEQLREPIRIPIASKNEAISARNTQVDVKQQLDKIPVKGLPNILENIKTLNSSIAVFLNSMSTDSLRESVADVFGNAELATCIQTVRDLTKQFTSKLPPLTAKAYTVIGIRTVSPTDEIKLIEQVINSSRHQGINLDDIHDEGKASRILDVLINHAEKLEVVIIKCNAPSEKLKNKIKTTLETLREKNPNISLEIQGQPEHYQPLVTRKLISQVTDTTVAHQQSSVLKDHNPQVQGLSRGRSETKVVTRSSEKRRSSSRS